MNVVNLATLEKAEIVSVKLEEYYEQIKAYATAPYHNIIRQSRIVSPYAVINSFTRDFNETAVEFNDVMLAVEIKIEDIQQGRLYIDNGDGTFTLKRNFNISDMTSKSRGDVAYTMLDIEAPATAEIVAELGKIEGVYRVRVVK